MQGLGESPQNCVLTSSDSFPYISTKTDHWWTRCPSCAFLQMICCMLKDITTFHKNGPWKCWRLMSILSYLAYFCVNTVGVFEFFPALPYRTHDNCHYLLCWYWCFMSFALSTVLAGFQWSEWKQPDSNQQDGLQWSQTPQSPVSHLYESVQSSVLCRVFCRLLSSFKSCVLC